MDDFDWDAYLNAMGIGDQAKPPVASRTAPVQEPPEVKRPDVQLQAERPSVPERMPVPDPIKLPAPPRAETSDPNLESFRQVAAQTPGAPSNANVAGQGVGAAIELALMF